MIEYLALDKCKLVIIFRYVVSKQYILGELRFMALNDHNRNSWFDVAEDLITICNEKYDEKGELIDYDEYWDMCLNITFTDEGYVSINKIMPAYPDYGIEIFKNEEEITSFIDALVASRDKAFGEDKNE